MNINVTTKRHQVSYSPLELTLLMESSEQETLWKKFFEGLDHSVIKLALENEYKNSTDAELNQLASEMFNQIARLRLEFRK